MRTILGLDLGVSSIGWALVREGDNENETSSIIKLGVRVNPLTVDETSNFERGKSITTNADRTLKRSMRRNLQRYKLRRNNLIEILKRNGFISEDSILSETGNKTTFETHHLRAKAVTERVTLDQLARVLLMINKKRGYKSSRKSKSQDEGQLIDGLEVAKRLYEDNLTPGQLIYLFLKEGKKNIPDFYRSDLQIEFDKVWNFQSQFYPEILTDDLKTKSEGKSKLNTAKLFLALHGVYTAENKNKDKRLQAAKWRVDGLKKQLTVEEVAFVISEINGEISNSSGYLGDISDRSKELFFHKQTVGQFLMMQLKNNPNTSLKNKVFYRQDYLNEFEAIWENQAKYHDVLTPELKQEIRDVVIFYQRRLKSQKGLISFCEFESKEIEIIVDGKKKIKKNGFRVCPKSSPIFQEFKIWQILNDIVVKNEGGGFEKRFLTQEEKETLFKELNIKKEMKASEVIKLLFKKTSKIELNIDRIEGNRTQAALFEVYQDIIELSGHGKYVFQKMNSSEVLELVSSVFCALGYNVGLLNFDSTLEGSSIEKQPLFQLWHLLYSFEGDKSNTGNEKLIQKITDLFGFEKSFSTLFAKITFQNDYGSLSAKAIRRILPYLREGMKYSDACFKAGYQHSAKSMTVEEKEQKQYKERLENFSKNSLRNPVVEKILNQMINVINLIIDTYGKPDEIRIELARELRKNAKQRALMTQNINQTAINNEEVKNILKNKFGLSHISRNDIIRYKLYEELKHNGYHTLYSKTYISPEKLFSKEFDIEHIIPQSRLFDDSFSNKTLELSSINREKGNDTAWDYIFKKKGDEGVEDYEQRLDSLFKQSAISKAKYVKLKIKGDAIPDGFINRDLNDTQYIAKKAKEILEELVKNVVSTTGAITDRLREDWQLVDVMKELNWDKYDKLGLTEVFENRDGHIVKRITDWTKRNDHRHHAMDALTVAFTKHVYIQYLNNLNSRIDKTSDIYGIEQKYLSRDSKNKLKFKPPMQLHEFRKEARMHLENLFVSIKAKNKVATTNVNTIDKKEGVSKKKQLTPRGQLHNETIYGRIQQYVTKTEKVGASFDEIKIAKVVPECHKKALLKRLALFDNDPRKAFSGKNSISKSPLFLDENHTEMLPEKVKLVNLEYIYTIRKEIAPDLKLDKVIDHKIRKILQARLNEFGGDNKKAFSNLEENPIWLNEKKGICIKRVTIRGVSNANALHDKKDKDGRFILDKEGRKIPVDFVNTGNNHHVAIYKDKAGNLQETVVSFFEATMRATLHQPIIDKSYNASEGWEFLFTMKQNEYFVFPNPHTGFDPNEIDLKNPDNYSTISPNLFRVQKIATRDYFFRHHLETNVDDNNALKGITWLRIGLGGLTDIVKVRVNHIGQIVNIEQD
ncbi:type II CRISPR RNA-guided endonuclease Cas9 [Massilibacteroides vaginae]|uniref:type II CRISPR RNA-guided endonuclease Cas9 n=1 Tax=Massilibacteroides vaginae TaxID=1673718 RepID=UPI000A1C8852|nr:type II CRISPR RNA-guided endonuclease Cas9 [Massilibacteroides vaginae]